MAVVVILAATPLGIGVGYDSYFYLSGAESLQAGSGFARELADGSLQPITHFPPFFSALMALGASALSANPAAIGRWLVALLFGANVGIVGFLVWRWTASSALGVIAGIFALFSPVLLEQHLWAMSEPLYLMFLLGTLGLLVRWTSEYGRGLLFAAGLAAGLAYLTRYVGTALIATGVLFLLTRRIETWRERALNLMGFAAPSLAIVVGWLARNAAVGDSLTNRSLFFHPPGMEKMREAAVTLSGWTLPVWGPREVRAGLTAVLIVSLFILWVRERWLRSTDLAPARPWKEALDTVGLHLVLYGLALLASLTFFDASTRLRDRILLPAYLNLMLAGFTLAGAYLRRASRPWVPRVGLLAVVAVFHVPYGLQSWAAVTHAREVGLGFNSRSWVSSETLAAVEATPLGTLIYTNEAFPLSYHTRRPVHGAPERIDPVKGQERPDYEEQLSTMRSRLASEGGVLVLFHPDNLRVEMPSLEELTEGLTLASSHADGRIYRPDADHGNDGGG